MLMESERDRSLSVSTSHTGLDCAHRSPPRQFSYRVVSSGDLSAGKPALSGHTCRSIVLSHFITTNLVTEHCFIGSHCRLSPALGHRHLDRNGFANLLRDSKCDAITLIAMRTFSKSQVSAICITRALALSADPPNCLARRARTIIEY